LRGAAKESCRTTRRYNIMVQYVKNYLLAMLNSNAHRLKPVPRKPCVNLPDS
jgi:hypothetical protein